MEALHRRGDLLDETKTCIDRNLQFSAPKDKVRTQVFLFGTCPLGAGLIKKKII